MKQELSVLDYKFGLESLESTCPSGEKGVERVSTATVPATHVAAISASATDAIDASAASSSAAVSSAPISSAAIASAAIASAAAVYSETGSTAPLTVEDPQAQTPAVISQSGIRKRVAPSAAPADDTNEPIAAFTASKNIIQPIQTENLQTPFYSPQTSAPYAVAPATTTDT